jgi:large subunit ribosomal protein L18e
MKSNTKISKQLERKNNPELVKIIVAAKKKKNWKEIAAMISGPRRKRTNFNLREINEKVKAGEKIIVPGKILSQGDLDKKIKLIALGFSERAKEKILKSKSEISNILEEIKLNPEMKELRVLR